MYYIYDWYDDDYRYFDDWETLIDFIDSYIHDNEIGHNKNDVYAYWDYEFSHPEENVDYATIIANQAKKLLLGEDNAYTPNNRHVYCRPYIVYDQWDRVVNLFEIRKALTKLKG